MEEVAAATALLGFDGEVSTQRAFDVITFATGAHSWSQEFERRNKMLEEGRVMLAGRQVRYTCVLQCMCVHNSIHHHVV